MTSNYRRPITAQEQAAIDASWDKVVAKLNNETALTAGSRLLAGFLFGVNPHDPLVFVTVPVVLAVTAVVASAAPTKKAIGVDPVEAVRSDG